MDKIEPKDDLVERAKFPILGSNGAKIDWQLVVDHGKQAQANHYQSVKGLASRGGLSWCELHAVLHNRPWQKMDGNTAIVECRALEARYLNADRIEAQAKLIEGLQTAILDLLSEFVGEYEGEIDTVVAARTLLASIKEQ